MLELGRAAKPLGTRRTDKPRTRLTELGRRVLDSYDVMELKAMATIAAEVRAFSRLLKAETMVQATGSKREMKS